MEQIPATHLRDYDRLTLRGLRQRFVIAGLFQPGSVTLHHWEVDRTVVGSAVPRRGRLTLEAPAGLRAEYFNERRELGIVNLGGPGTVEVDGLHYALGRHDCLYVGRGARSVAFRSQHAASPAQFYLLSHPAHARHPTRLVRFAATAGKALGSAADQTERVLYKFIHPEGVRSCQLVMGLTIIAPGSRWNSMPPHTHLRRSEVYLYFGLPARGKVTHFMGRPDGIRKLPLRDREAVLAPPWSVHCGVGTTDYGFIWAMGGENQDFADMDPVDPKLIR
jgi:4-deoxy-L-threo-5-hexosulose-uronate ketol-isomerase